MSSNKILDDTNRILSWGVYRASFSPGVNSLTVPPHRSIRLKNMAHYFAKNHLLPVQPHQHLESPRHLKMRKEKNEE